MTLRILTPLCALRAAYVLGSPIRGDIGPLMAAATQAALAIAVLALLVATIDVWSDA